MAGGWLAWGVRTAASGSSVQLVERRLALPSRVGPEPHAGGDSSAVGVRLQEAGHGARETGLTAGDVTDIFGIDAGRTRRGQPRGWLPAGAGRSAPSERIQASRQSV